MSFTYGKEEQSNIDEIVKDHEVTPGQAQIQYIKIANDFMQNNPSYNSESTCLLKEDFKKVIYILDVHYDNEV